MVKKKETPLCSHCFENVPYNDMYIISKYCWGDDPKHGSYQMFYCPKCTEETKGTRFQASIVREPVIKIKKVKQKKN